MDIGKIKKLADLIRYYSLTATTAAGSGHPTSSLSATDLMAALLFGGFYRFDFDHPENPSNDRLIFSKGHASPLFYALFLAGGVITPEEMMTLRKFDSRLEGHPTPRFPYTEAATGSLGQGLSVGVGMSLALHNLFPKSPKLPNVFVLLGDSEMAEGEVWEGINLAGYYKLNNLFTILDINRLGQTQATMFEWNTDIYKNRFEAFGWDTRVIDGHDYQAILDCYKEMILQKKSDKPTVIIAKTIKGKGVSFLENKDGWHGKPIPKDQLESALKELGEVDLKIRGKVEKPEQNLKSQKSNARFDREARRVKSTVQSSKLSYKIGDEIATRKAYGTAIARLGETYSQIVSLDAEVKNSTYAEIFKDKFPDRFFEMFIAEQNMVSAAVGFAKLGFMPFVSSFAAFLTRGFDQIRMAALSGVNIRFCGSHAGVSIGEDGPSQMGLEDIAMFRAVCGSTVLYPADAVSAEKLVEEMLNIKGISYLRTTRPGTPVIYNSDEKFTTGGSKVHKLPEKLTSSLQSPKQNAIIVAAGITLYEALKAQEELVREGIESTVVDCYSIKPIDVKTLQNLATTLNKIDYSPVDVFVVEDHFIDGGLGDAVLSAFGEREGVRVYKMGVSKMPRSGKTNELLDFEEISSKAIIRKVLEIVK